MRTRWMILVLAMLVPFAVVSTTSTTASAQLPSEKQRKEQAKNAYSAGKAKLDAGNYSGALTDFQLADTSWPGAAPKYYIAFCLDKLGRNSEAVSAYRRFVSSNPGAKYADKIALANQRISELEQAEKAKAQGKLMINVNPPVPGITISVDGQPITGTETSVPAGPHSVEATAPGYAPFSTQVDVVGGTQLEVPIAMQRAAAPAPAPSRSKGNGLIIAGYVVGGVGVVAGVMVAVFGSMALSSASDFDANPTVELADDTDRNGLIADVFLPFAIAGIGAGAVLLGIGYSQNTGMVKVGPMYANGGGGAQIVVDW